MITSCVIHILLLFYSVLGLHTSLPRHIADGAHFPSNTFQATLRTIDPKHSSDLSRPLPEGAISPATTVQTISPALEEIKSVSSGINLLPIPGTEFYPSSQLTKQPEAIEIAELDSHQLQAIIVSGTIILQLRISNQGQVVDAEVEESGLPDTFAQTAIAAFRASSFRPGERDGVPVGSIIRIEVRYDDPNLTNQYQVRSFGNMN